jgi:hypothetical protein
LQLHAVIGGMPSDRFVDSERLTGRRVGEEKFLFDTDRGMGCHVGDIDPARRIRSRRAGSGQ